MKKTLIYTDGLNAVNSNKFYTLTLEGDSVVASYGRVGTSPQTRSYSGGQRKFDSIIREKLAKGYTEALLTDTVVQTVSSSKVNLSSIAKSQIKGSYGDLVDRLSEMNVHNILEGTAITINKDSGLFQTPLGIITSEAIQQAHDLLDKISTLFLNNSSSDTFNLDKMTSQYLRVVPKNIGVTRPLFRNIFSSQDILSKEYSILESLKGSVEAISVQSNVKDSEVNTPVLWTTILDLVTDLEILKYVESKYNSTRQSRHSCYNMQVKSVYKVSLPEKSKSYLSMIFKYLEDTKQTELKSPEVLELWHGSAGSNILSILKSGLQCSPPTTAKIAGKLFGPGTYFSDQSTKSLGYASGYWSGQKTKSAFMFIQDVFMGNIYYPRSTGSCINMTKQGYHSVWAQPKYVTSLLNNEMIIYNTDQIDYKYLVEFE